ncbi:FCD domain-containing protein [Burkholderia anthina]|uniref:GntR family transcriptional regulator n=1 Tax=Burkholderia anthina TaxID=179879 RepID=UPI001ABAC3D0|nr:FCD domain-containing protein [Burkholderia anthina]MBY4866067.1 FCD domain-containing protein [Burkholderia anthina]
MTFDDAAAGGSRTMASVLADTILRDIVSGALAPGSKLKIRELADRYQAGVIPLREAVSRLAMSGFVDAEDQRGFRVTPVSRADLEDITSVRQCIESEALRDAIDSGNLEWEASVLAAFHLVNSLPTVVDEPPRMNPDWERAHDHFHATLLAGCRSKWLKHFAATLRTQTARYRHQSLRSQHAGERDVGREHEEIVKAVLARDADRACELLRRHFAVTAQLVLEDPTPADGAPPAMRIAGKTRARR